MRFFNNFLPSCESCEMRSWKLFCRTCNELLRFQNSCTTCGCSPIFPDWVMCFECQRQSWPWKEVFISFEFREGVESWIREIKQSQQEQAWRELELEHLPAALRNLSLDGICYVPSDPQNFSKRGFDSSFTLGKRISKLLGISLERDVFWRKTFLKAQQEMSLVTRRQLPNQLFQLHRRPKGRKLLLVDDVMTSGGSLLRCAELLQAEGHEVYVYVVSRKLKAPLTLRRRAS